MHTCAIVCRILSLFLFFKIDIRSNRKFRHGMVGGMILELIIKHEFLKL